MFTAPLKYSIVSPHEQNRPARALSTGPFAAPAENAAQHLSRTWSPAQTWSCSIRRDQTTPSSLHPGRRYPFIGLHAVIPSSLPKNPPHELSPAPPHGVLVAIFQEFKDLLQDTTLITRLSKRSRFRNGADRALLCYIPFPHFMPKWPPLTHQSRENRSSEAPASYFMPTWPSLTLSSGIAQMSRRPRPPPIGLRRSTPTQTN